MAQTRPPWQSTLRQVVHHRAVLSREGRGRHCRKQAKPQGLGSGVRAPAAADAALVAACAPGCASAAPLQRAVRRSSPKRFIAASMLSPHASSTSATTCNSFGWSVAARCNLARLH